MKFKTKRFVLLLSEKAEKGIVLVFLKINDTNFSNNAFIK